MIEYVAKYFPTSEGAQKARLRAFAQRLLDVNPSARPKLNQLQGIPRKRKASESHHDSVPKRHAPDIDVGVGHQEKPGALARDSTGTVP